MYSLPDDILFSFYEVLPFSASLALRATCRRAQAAFGATFPHWPALISLRKPHLEVTGQIAELKQKTKDYWEWLYLEHPRAWARAQAERPWALVLRERDLCRLQGSERHLQQKKRNALMRVKAINLATFLLALEPRFSCTGPRSHHYLACTSPAGTFELYARRVSLRVQDQEHLFTKEQQRLCEVFGMTWERREAHKNKT